MGSPNLRKRKSTVEAGLPLKIMTPETPREAERKVVYMEIDTAEEGVGSSDGVITPIADRIKATPRRRIPSLGRKKGVKKVDGSQRLISALFSKNIAGVERLSDGDDAKDPKRNQKN